MGKLSAVFLAASMVVSVAHGADADQRTVTLDVTNMDCAACPITVRKALEKVPGVGLAKVDYKAKRAVVVFDPAKTTPDALTKATADAGFPSSVKEEQ